MTDDEIVSMVVEHATDLRYVARQLGKRANLVPRSREAIYRIEQRKRARFKRRNMESRDTAAHHGQQWTGPELELAARTDLTRAQVADMTGRTLSAVKNIRRKLEYCPRLQAML